VSGKEWYPKYNLTKIHIFVNLISKKILSCIMTKDISYNVPKLTNDLKQYDLTKYNIYLNDGVDSS